MADASPPTIQECRTCGALIDTVDEEPLALIHCPNCGEAMRVRRMFDHFEIQEVLGAGGMGAVYRAQDTKLNRPVALKVLRTEHIDKPDLIESLTKEAAITASISHPHVVKVYSTGTSNEIYYIAMELVDKGSLDDLMGLQGQVAEIQVLEVGVQIAQGLNAAFQRGLIHRDVKPGNILFADAHTAKITDFGLAILQEHVGQVAGEVWGTPYYVAPEKLENPPKEDFRSDIYSLGATLFHALAGRPPFEAETASLVALKHLKSQVVSIQSFAPDISSATTYVINKALSKDPEQRYQSYEEFVKSLQYAHAELFEAARNPQQKRRVVVGSVGEEAMSWVTFAMVAFIVLTGVLLFTFREHFFGKPKARPNPVVAAAQQARSSIDTEFAAAQDLLAKGKSAEAAAALRALDEKGGSAQPMQNWITLHGGLAFFLLNQPEEAHVELLKIKDRGTYSSDSLEKEIVSFFVETALLADKPEPLPASIAKDYDKFTYRSFALLLFAVKDWYLGAFEDAGALFRQFQSATPPEHYAWINKLKPIADPFIADYTAWRPAAEAVKNADTPEKQKQALDVLRTARGQLKQGSKLLEFFDREESRLDKLTRLEEDKQHQVKAGDEATDAKTIAGLKEQLKTYGAQYKFAEAKRVIASAAPALKSEKGKSEHQLLLSYATGLAQFKATLISDINARGYTQAVPKKNGSFIPVGKFQASEGRLEMVATFGSVQATWPDLAPNGVVTMAATYLKAAPSPDRQWQLGLFLIQLGFKKQGLDQLQQAANASPELLPLLPRFQETFGNP